MRKLVNVLIYMSLYLVTLSQNNYPFVYLQQKSYYRAYECLDSLKSAYVDNKYENAYWQALGTLYSFCGKYDKAINCFTHRDSIMGKTNQDSVLIDLNKAEVCIDTLENLYRNNDVILLNEAHHISKHRAFLYSQLPILKKSGYKFLAIEALNTGQWKDSNLVNRTYPIYTKTGIYINDPIFAHAIRKALKLGFKLIFYESYKKDREKQQATNILKSYNPAEGKLIVYAGYAHICKSQQDSLMAYFLSNTLDQKILSISQNIPKSFIFENSEDNKYYLLKANNNCYDYYVHYSSSKTNCNIPNWFTLLTTTFKPLSKYYSKKILPKTLIQLFYAKENNGIPVYQYLFESNQKCEILLPFFRRDDYILKILNSNNKDSVIITY